MIEPIISTLTRRHCLQISLVASTCNERMPSWISFNNWPQSINQLVQLGSALISLIDRQLVNKTMHRIGAPIFDCFIIPEGHLGGQIASMNLAVKQNIEPVHKN